LIPNRRWRRRSSTLGACAALAALLAGCASSGPKRPSIVSQLAARGVPAEAAAPVELTQEMRAWVKSTVPKFASAKAQLDALLLALLTRDGRPMVYTPGVSRTAIEAWETGRANCLSFSHLFVGLARELGIQVYYLRVRDLSSYSRQGDLVVASDHVTAAFGMMKDRVILDFSPQPQVYRLTEALPDMTALALHYSNVGAELIQAGDLEAARAKFELAIRIDPGLGDAWLNLGVVKRRSADLVGAEEAYRRALVCDPDLVAAYQNLATVLEIEGRRGEAREVLALSRRAGNRNPFSYLALGDLALRDERIDDAESLFRRARSLDPGSPEPPAALGEVALARGKVRQARALLEKAEKLGRDNPRVLALARSLRENEPNS